MNVYYYTFGMDHYLPGGKAAWQKVVRVSVPDHTDPRPIFLAWLGSSRFSGEYTEAEAEASQYIILPDQIACSITVKDDGGHG